MWKIENNKIFLFWNRNLWKNKLKVILKSNQTLKIVDVAYTFYVDNYY